MSFVIITMLTNKAYFFNFDLLSGDGGTTT